MVRSGWQVPEWFSGLCIGATGGAAVAYMIARAVLVPLTFDEAGAFLTNIEGDVGAAVDFATAQNHLLQTLPSRLAFAAFASTWALRAPSVVGGVVYLAAAFAVARRTGGGPAAGSFVVMAANPYLLEYFALGRGYGLAVGLAMAAIVAHLE